MISLLQSVPALEVEPGDLVHHPRLAGPLRALWVLRGSQTVQVLTTLEPELVWLELPVAGSVMVNDRAGDNQTARLLAAVRGGRALLADEAGGAVDAAHVQLLIDALAAHAGRHPSLRAMVHSTLAADASWVPARTAI